jgi:hypothetical protein
MLFIDPEHRTEVGPVWFGLTFLKNSIGSVPKNCELIPSKTDTLTNWSAYKKF